MKLDLNKLSGLVQTYGARLYEQGEHIGSVTDGEDGVAIAGNSLSIPDGAGGTMYVPFRRDTVPTAGATFELHIFIAQRDASGEFEGKAWSVGKGEQKVFAS